MMQLGQKTQQDLMVLIKKVLGEELNCDSGSSQRVQELNAIITELQSHLQLLTEENTQLTMDRNQLTAELGDLQLESAKGLAEDCEIAVIHRIEKRLRVREAKVFELESDLLSTKKEHDTQLTAITDELDLANAQIIKLAQHEKTAAQYKNRLEKLGNVKTQLKEYTRNNEELKATVKQQRLQLGDLVSLQKALKQCKSELHIEKDKVESLQFAKKNKDKEARELQNTIVAQEEKLKFSAQQIKDLELKILNQSTDSVILEDSATLNSELQDIRRNNTRGIRATTFASIDHFQQNIEAETRLKELLQQKKTQIKELKEQVFMQCEELHTKTHDFTQKTTQIESYNAMITQEMALTTSNQQADKVERNNLLYEVAEYKQNKEHLLAETKRLCQEKDKVHTLYIEAKDELIELKNTLFSKDNELAHKKVHEELLENRIKTLEESEKSMLKHLNDIKSDNGNPEDYKILYMGIQTDYLAQHHETNLLQSKLNESNKTIKFLIAEREKILLTNEEIYNENILRTKNKYRTKVHNLISQTTEAVNSLQNEKEQLSSRLDTERKVTMIQRGTIQISSPSDIESLKKDLRKRNRDIEYLSVANHELKQVWKDTAKILKQVCKEVGTETTRIEQTVRCGRFKSKLPCNHNETSQNSHS